MFNRKSNYPIGFTVLAGFLFIGLLTLAVFSIAYYTIIALLISIILVSAEELISYNKNKKIVKNNQVEEIYIREVKVAYSPAVCSLLMNFRLEERKDIAATLLNMMAKKIINISKEKDSFIMEPTDTEILLTVDEEYLLDTIIKKRKSFQIEEWKRLVNLELTRYNFINKEKAIDTNSALPWIIGFMVIGLANSFTDNSIILLGIYCFGFYACLASLKKLLSFNQRGLVDISKYTTEGALEVSKWQKFTKFLNDFTFVNENPAQMVVVLEQYLSYAMVLNINKDYYNKIFNELNKYLEVNGILEHIDKSIHRDL